MVGLRMLGALAGATVLAGCLGDPPPDPATAPLEIVLDGSAVNRTQVGDGRHAVSVVGEGEVTVRDAAGREVLSVVSEGDGLGHLQTTAQDYTVECVPAAGPPGSARFTSVAG